MHPVASFNAKAGEERLRDDMIEEAWSFADMHVDPMEDPTRSYHGGFGKLSGDVFPSEAAARSFLERFEGTYRDGYVFFRWSGEETGERRITRRTARPAGARRATRP